MHSKLLLCPGLVCNSYYEEKSYEKEQSSKQGTESCIHWYNGVISAKKNHHS